MTLVMGSVNKDKNNYTKDEPPPNLSWGVLILSKKASECQKPITGEERVYISKKIDFFDYSIMYNIQIWI